MREYHKKLVKAKGDKKLGSHSVERFGANRFFYYHGNNVCVVNDIEKTYELDACGWGSHMSTKDCLAGYREYFTGQGYKEIHPKPIYDYEMKGAK